MYEYIFDIANKYHSVTDMSLNLCLLSFDSVVHNYRHFFLLCEIIIIIFWLSYWTPTKMWSPNYKMWNSKWENEKSNFGILTVLHLKWRTETSRGAGLPAARCEGSRRIGFPIISSTISFMFIVVSHFHFCPVVFSDLWHDTQAYYLFTFVFCGIVQQTPLPGLRPWTPLGDFRPQTPLLWSQKVLKLYHVLRCKPIHTHFSCTI